MTDNEIIKALECCKEGNCKSCEFIDVGFNVEDCMNALTEKAFDLINRQKAEIARLQKKNLSREQDRDYWMVQTRMARGKVKNAKSEAIKEFAERLKEKFCEPYDYSSSYMQGVIDNLVEEMTEE